LYDKKESKPEPIIDERPTQASPQLPRIMAGGMLVNSQSVTGVRFDARRNLARSILGQWEHSKENGEPGDIDITETAWLKPRVNTKDPHRKLPKRWQGKDNDFRQCKKDWEQEGILGRENPDNEKSRFTVRDPDKLRDIAEGRL